MPQHSVAKLNDTELQKQYGDTIAYTYGNAPGEHTLYVYRFVQMYQSGNRYEYTQKQLEELLTLYHVRIVPLLDTIQYDGDQQALTKRIEALTEGSSTLDNTHIREGIVIRVETPDNRIYFLKHKSFAFKVMEGIIKDNDSIVDIEEAS